MSAISKSGKSEQSHATEACCGRGRQRSKPAHFQCASGSDSPEKRELLVIGCGNTLRCDDGAGVKAAETVVALNLSGIRVLACHQLLPELAEAISHAAAVVFVDANAKPASDVESYEIEALDAAQIFAHSTNPRSLLGLAGALFGRIPPAWTLTIPVEDFDFGDRLSPYAQAGIHAAVEKIKQISSHVAESLQVD
jgi:hydrogenase maturation protease